MNILKFKKYFIINFSPYFLDFIFLKSGFNDISNLYLSAIYIAVYVCIIFYQYTTTTNYSAL